MKIFSGENHKSIRHKSTKSKKSHKYKRSSNLIALSLLHSLINFKKKGAKSKKNLIKREQIESSSEKTHKIAQLKLRLKRSFNQKDQCQRFLKPMGKNQNHHRLCLFAGRDKPNTIGLHLLPMAKVKWA